MHCSSGIVAGFDWGGVSSWRGEGDVDEKGGRGETGND